MVRSAVALTFTFVSGYFVGALATGSVADPLFYAAPAGALIVGAVIIFREIHALSANTRG
jgi:F0F1-type ATP synthase assembly protein I